MIPNPSLQTKSIEQLQSMLDNGTERQQLEAACEIITRTSNTMFEQLFLRMACLERQVTELQKSKLAKPSPGPPLTPEEIADVMKDED